MSVLDRVNQAYRETRQPSNELISISDPAIERLFGVSPSYAGVEVNEYSALANSALYRGCLIVSASIAGLPLRSLRDVEGVRTRVTSVFDDPGGVVGLIPFVWKQIQVFHRMLWGDTFLRHVYNGAGALVGLQPLHPRCVSVRWDSRLPGGKLFTYTDLDGRIWELDARNMTQIMGMTLDGLRGIGIIDRARTSMGAAIAADRAAATMFGKGALFGGLVTPDGDDLDPDDEKKMEELVNRELNGWEHAASLRFINRPLKISPWTQISPEDMQFLESRQFSIQEVARWTGVPANLLMDPGAVSTWGTGVEIQNRGLARFTLTAHTKPMEEAYSRLATPATKFVEFDYAGLERGSPQEEIHLLLDEVEGGVRSKEEYRHVRNMGPADPNDTFAPIGGSAKKKTPTQDQARLPLRAQAHVGHPLDELIGAHR